MTEYTEKQIRHAKLIWENDIRLNPQLYIFDEVGAQISVIESAKVKSEYLSFLIDQFCDKSESGEGTYRQKHIYEAQLRWETDLRMHPENFISQAEIDKKSSVEAAEIRANTLLKYLEKVENE